MAKTWRIINAMTNRTNSSRVVKQVQCGNSVIDDPTAIAGEFNKFFVNVGPNLAKRISASSKSPMEFLSGNYFISMYLLPTTAEEISDIISNLKNSASAGYDNFQTKLIKFCSNELASIMAHVNNQSLIEGVFPDHLKIARVVPIFKGGDIKLVSNYRPISILPTFSKISEKIMYARLEKYLTQNSILHKNQFGFRPKLSTGLALLELLDKLSSSIDMSETTVGVFIDLAKAFDTVNHQILLNKLQHYGIRGVAFCWFQSYLTARQQCVTVTNYESELAEIRCGVPQGSILGPVLFLIYINDLNLASKLLSTIMFADDTNLFFTGKSVHQIENIMNSELTVINEWFKANLLSLNLDKTSYIIFSNKKILNLNIKIQETTLIRQYETKFLGVILTDKPKWNKHIDVVSGKASKYVGIISKVRHLIPLHLTRLLYSNLVEPYITYCNLVWCLPVKTVMLDKILKTQKSTVV